jgi:hypothetical protein
LNFFTGKHPITSPILTTSRCKPLSQNQKRLVARNADRTNHLLKPFVDARSVVQFRTALSNGWRNNIFLVSVTPYVLTKQLLIARNSIGRHTSKCGRLLFLSIMTCTRYSSFSYSVVYAIDKNVDFRGVYIGEEPQKLKKGEIKRTRWVFG